MDRAERAKELCDLGLRLLSCKYDGFKVCQNHCKQFQEMLKIADYIELELQKARVETAKEILSKFSFDLSDEYNEIPEQFCKDIINLNEPKEKKQLRKIPFPKHIGEENNA